MRLRFDTENLTRRPFLLHRRFDLARPWFFNLPAPPRDCMEVHDSKNIFRRRQHQRGISPLSSVRLVRCSDYADVKAQIAKQHDEAVKRLQDWIKQVSIAAEDRGYPEGADYMIKLAKDAGFQQAALSRDRRQAGRVRHTRRRCGQNGRHLFHVRREAVRSGGMELTADWRPRIVDKPGTRQSRSSVAGR